MVQKTQINLNSSQDIINFIHIMNKEENPGKYSIEDNTGTHRVSAASPLSVVYACMEFNKPIFLVNEIDNVYPNGIDQFKR